MAEMKWLATDFMEERKRHGKWRKTINKGVLAVAKEKEQEKIKKREVWTMSDSHEIGISSETERSR